MAKVSEDVMKMVEKELNKDPDVGNDTLFEKAKKLDSSIGKLTLRQFHARYPLQVKRRKAQARGGKRTRKLKKKSRAKAGTTAKRSTGGSANGAREAVRATFLSFASDLAAAEARKDLVDVLASVDEYVDRAIKAVEG